MVEVVLQLGASAFEVEDFLLQPDYGRPFLLQQPVVLLRRIWREGRLWQAQVFSQRSQGGGGEEVGAGKVGKEGLVAVSWAISGLKV